MVYEKYTFGIMITPFYFVLNVLMRHALKFDFNKLIKASECTRVSNCPGFVDNLLIFIKVYLCPEKMFQGNDVFRFLLDKILIFNSEKILLSYTNIVITTF